MTLFPIEDQKITVKENEVQGPQKAPNIPDRNPKLASKVYKSAAPQSALDVICTKSDLSPEKLLNNENDKSEV